MVKTRIQKGNMKRWRGPATKGVLRYVYEREKENFPT
jgi:hypothetical protein